MSSVNFVGSEFPINTITTGSQNTSFSIGVDEPFSTRAIAVDGSGGFVVVWTGPDGGGSNTGIYARRFDSAGVAQSLFDADSSALITTDALINTTTANVQRLASVAADADGNFIVVWESAQDPVTGDSGVYAQRFDKDGNRIGGETQIHTNVLGDQTEVSVAMSATGEFVVTWTSDVGDGSGTGVFVRRFNSAGVAQPIQPPTGPASTNDVQVNTTTDLNQRISNVAIAPDGSFVVTWSSVGQDGDGYGVYAQKFSSTGARIGAEISVNSTTASNQQNSQVAIDGSGNFVITWSSENQDGSGWGVYARLFDSNGDPLTGEILVNQFTTGEQRYSTVAMDNDGNFVITWQSFSQPSETVTTTGIVGRRFSKTGTPLGDEFLVNTTTPGDQRFPAVGVAPSGNFVVVWTGPDANGNGIYGQRFSPPTSTAPTDILLTPASFPENSPLDTVIGNLSAIDPDGDTVTSFELIDSVNFPDNASFEIQTGPGGPILVLRTAADFETKNSYTIKIRATDPSGLSYEKEVVVAVTNVNEAPTAINLDPQSVDENSPIGTEVGIFTTIDPDFVDTHTYTLVSGTGDTDNASFTIVGNQLRLNVSPDFETKDSYTIRVRTTDSGNLFFEQSFTITINDIDETLPNQAPTAIALTPTNVDENVPIGTTVGTFTTTDPDTGDTHTYTLVAGTGDTDNASFTIVGNQLRLNVSPDFETKDSYTIRVRTTDSGNLFFEQSFTITINDIDETLPNQAPTAITLGSTQVNENVPIGTVVGTFATIDPNTSDTHTYTLVAGAGSADNSSFEIVGNQLRLRVSPDFETKNSYSIRVRTTDSGNLFFEQSFIITINDLPELPTIVNQPPTDIALSSLSVLENVPANTIIGQFDSSDPDHSSGFTYTLVSGAGSTDNAAFLIEGDRLRIQSSPDFETKRSYSIRVRTTDPSGGSFEKVFIISVLDVDETPPNVSASIVVDLNGTAAGIDFSIGAPTVASIKVAAPNATITKTSPTNLTQLVVNLTNPINGASERLIADVSGTNLRTNYDPTGVLTIWGSAPAAVYQQVLRTVTYENSAAVPNTSTRTIFAAASDGQTFSPIARTTLNFVGLRQVDGTDGDDVLATTPNTDLLSGRAGNDIVRSTLANLRQQDVIRGGPGVDTFVLTNGTGTITVNVGNFNSQLPDVSPGTLVTEFEVFDLSGFRGNALMIGADNFDDYLVGGIGNDTLDGGTGNNTLIGGLGNDVYIVRNPADTIIERPNEGNDTVQAAVNYTLPDHVENMVLIDNARNGTGNAQNNRITGNALRNLLQGGAGNDTLLGLAGADTLLGEEGNDLLDGGRGRSILTGGQGRDTFVFGVGRGLGRSIVTDFNLRQDRILVRGTGLSAGRIDAAQFIRGTSARRQSDRFIYDANTGRLFFDPDGTGSQRQVLIGTLSNRPSLGAGNIIVG